MPGRSLNEQIDVVVHVTARDFLAAALPSLSKRESAANIILPHALEVLGLEGNTTNVATNPDEQSSPTLLSKRVGPTYAVDFWLTCWSLPDRADPVLDLVLSCTRGSFGTYPIYLYSSILPSEITRQFLDSRIRMLIRTLLTIVPTTRIFSVFGPASLVNNFSKQWSYTTGRQQEPEAIYAATFSYATRETLTASLPLPSGDLTRRATLHDASAVAQLLKEFADSSIYYPLSYGNSLREAVELTRKRQIWVYETHDGQIASIVAVTRSSPNVAAITKVYTAFTWRKQGYAEQLVRKVTRELLYSAGKQRVVLYVSHGNPAAKVYHRVGFTGLERKDVSGERDEWLEIGFQETHRGHW